MKKRILFCFMLLSILSGAQERYYGDPVKIPLLLSGSFAELRSNHFHSGIDIKTQGTTGFRIYAAADGYVSRIVVSPGGFGKALYINHPNGTTTVYGHLLTFNDTLNNYVKNEQYKEQSFRVDLKVPKHLFVVKQNEIIAKSGNSGSSGGPHLHFEIRDTETEEPLNPLKYDFPVTDNIPPKIFSVLLVPLTKQSHVNGAPQQKSYQVVFHNGKYQLKGNPTLPVWGKIGVAVQSNDYFNGSNNKCGINLLRMDLDKETQFSFQLNRFSFDNSRYLNSHIVYDAYKSSRRRYVKTWLDPGNRLPAYTHNGTEGIITPEEDKKQQIEIELQDTYGNTSQLVLSIVGSPKEIATTENSNSTLFKYNDENSLNTEEIDISIPNGALYKNLEFEYKKEQSPKGFYSDYHFVHNNSVPLHKAANIKIKAKNLPSHLEEKVIMAYVNPESGKFSAAGGKFEKGWVETQTKNLGVYAIVVDSLAPRIVSLSIKNKKLTESKRIRFKISDDLAGIQTIDAWMDGKWILFDYDAKTAKITHYFDKERFELNKRHNFRLEVTDYRGNISVYKSDFWK